MAIYQQKRDDPSVLAMRRQGGAWLRDLREKAGHTQRSFAAIVATDYYTFISQIENGRGRVPPDRYAVWADALGIDRRDFMMGIMQFYDPYAYEMLFGGSPQRDPE